MTAPDVTSLRALDRDFAEYGCEGTGEYKRCADMSDRFESLLDEVERLRAAVGRVEALLLPTCGCPENGDDSHVAPVSVRRLRAALEDQP